MTDKPKPKAKPKKPAAPKPASVTDPDKLPDASQPLSNARHERFCQNLAMHGMSQTQAYVLAGYPGTEETARRAGSALMTKSDIQARFQYLQQFAAALAVDAAALTKADIINMTVELYQQNIGLRPVNVTIGRGKQAVTVQTFAHNAKAANTTLKMLHDEWGLGSGGSASAGGDVGDIAARARLETPDIVERLDALRETRALVLAGGTDVDNTKKVTPSAADMATLKKLAIGK